MSKVIVATAVILLGVIAAVAYSCKPATPPTGTSAPGLTASPAPAPTLPPAPNPAPASTPTLTSKPVATASIEELKRKLEGGHSLAILDVRPKTDFDTSHIDSAISMPLQEIPNRYGEVPQGPEIIVYAECA